jgi:hypothetical protein
MHGDDYERGRLNRQNFTESRLSEISLFINQNIIKGLSIMCEKCERDGI